SGDTAIEIYGSIADLTLQGGLIEGRTAAISMNPLSSNLSATRLYITSQADPVNQQLPGIVGNIVGGADSFDTVILRGKGEFDDNFVNFEILKLEGGQWTVAGSSSFGVIDIENGIFQNDGRLSGNTVVRKGATLTGNGTFIGNVSNSGRLLLPGTGQTMIIDGNFYSGAEAEIIFDFDPFKSSQLKVTNKIELNGHLILNPVGSQFIADSLSLTLMDGRSITGDFSEISGLPESTAAVRYNLLIDRAVGDVILDIERKTYASLSATSNQQTVAEIFQSHLGPGFTTTSFATIGGVPTQFEIGPLGQVINRLEGAATEEEFQNTLDQLTGEAHTGNPAATFGGTQLFTGSLTGHLNDLRSGFSVADNSGSGLTLLASNDANLRSLGQMIGATNTQKTRNPMAAGPDEWVPFIRGYGVFSTLDKTGQNLGFDSTTGGVLLGVDKWLNDRVVVGGGLGYSSTSLDFTQAGNEGDVSSYKLALYGSYNEDNWYADGVLSYSYNGYTNNRIVLGSEAQSTHNGHEVSLYAGGGYMFEKGNWVYGPTGSLQYINLSESAFQELDDMGLGLSIEANSTSSIRSTLGGKAAYMWTLDNGMRVMPEARLRWAQEWAENEYTINAQFTEIAGSSFEIRGRDLANTSVYAGFGVTAQFNDRFTGFVQYDGDFRTEFTNHIVNVGLKYKF
ncbi:MAG: autotransporter domain-containing protein, partial [Nitrospinaceae bacterium]|nr:autotransporter domain-containing protein [Nitrospinaceae bacterium]NIR56356.1 autotransporter domain-containing protein [Nitrospinaceae bacterium]NIS86819.1 autotransporter domain-containing protein [Nitrospinaceae bacterium]NIT83655.1 autotransporter domain-containing protein [Nitrospinaceae bacterium]NIU45853.1 autotransporter domain-containing protein [Nitrospinaceae bacterium]